MKLPAAFALTPYPAPEGSRVWGEGQGIEQWMVISLGALRNLIKSA